MAKQIRDKMAEGVALGGTGKRLRALGHRPQVLDPQEIGQAG